MMRTRGARKKRPVTFAEQESKKAEQAEPDDDNESITSEVSIRSAASQRRSRSRSRKTPTREKTTRKRQNFQLEKMSLESTPSTSA
jgi:hypothetical protein